MSPGDQVAFAITCILAAVASVVAAVVAVQAALWIRDGMRKRRRVRGGPLSRRERKQFEQVWRHYDHVTAGEPGRRM